MTGFTTVQKPATHICAVLRKKILAGAIPSGGRLPTVRELTSVFHASASTVCKSLAMLEKEALVERRGRSGVYAYPLLHPEFTEQNVRKPVSERIAQDLTRRISVGEFRAGDPLPPRKTLRHRFSTSPNTLLKALRMMEQRRLIHRMGNTFVVGPLSSRRIAVPKRVAVLPAKAKDGGPPLRATLRPEFYGSFEKELSGNGIILSGRYGAASFAPARRVKYGKDEFGYLYSAAPTWWLDRVTGSTPDHLKKEMVRLSRFSRPIVIFNCAPIFTRFPGFSLAKYKDLYGLGYDNIGAGVAVGTYLAQLGHRKIGFFCYSTDQWNLQRLEGVKRGHRGIWGRESSVMEFRTHGTTNIEGRNSPKHVKVVANSLREWEKEILGYRAFAKLDPAPRLLGEFLSWASAANQLAAFEPHFEKALKDREITAWVASVHTIAFTAARFLSESGVRLPQELSLIGIDDDHTLADRDITGYDFQPDRMGYLAAHIILQDIPIRRNRKGMVECPGRIIERGSVARV